MKKIFAICWLSLALYACESADKDGWLKDANPAYKYKFLTAKNNALAIDYGDELTLSYPILKADSVLERNAPNEFLKIPMPTTEHRNAWENALMHATLGDSIAVSAIYKTVYNSMSRFQDMFAAQDWITCHFKVHAIAKRAEIERALEDDFFKQARYSSHAAMKKELEIVQTESDIVAKDLMNWVIDYSVGKKAEILKDEATQIRYQLVPNNGQYELINRGVVPKSGDTVLVHYMTMKMSDREIFDNSLARRHRFEFVVDKDQQYIPAFHHAAKRLAVGESAYFLMPADLCYGEEGSLPIVPPHTPLVFYVHLLGVLAK